MSVRDAANAFLAAWDRYQDVKTTGCSMEERLRRLKPFHDVVNQRVESLREAVETDPA